MYSGRWVLHRTKQWVMLMLPADLRRSHRQNGAASSVDDLPRQKPRQLHLPSANAQVDVRLLLRHELNLHGELSLVMRNRRRQTTMMSKLDCINDSYKSIN